MTGSVSGLIESRNSASASKTKISIAREVQDQLSKNSADVPALRLKPFASSARRQW